MTQLFTFLRLTMDEIDRLLAKEDGPESEEIGAENTPHYVISFANELDEVDNCGYRPSLDYSLPYNCFSWDFMAMLSRIYLQAGFVNDVEIKMCGFDIKVDGMEGTVTILKDGEVVDFVQNTAITSSV